MKTYLFNTTATMKDYNCEKWWIDSKIIGDLRIDANNLKDALKEYQNIVKDRCIEISDNAIKNKNPMYIDNKAGETIQTGYVITGKTEFEDRDNYKWSKQYIDLWVKIDVIENPFILKKGA